MSTHNPDISLDRDDTAQIRPQTSFSGYKWDYYASVSEGPFRTRVKQFIASTDWAALQRYATEQRNGRSCQILQDIGLGFNHVVRIVEFEDGVRWIARLRMPYAKMETPGGDAGLVRRIELKMRSEAAVIGLVRDRTHIPTPNIHAIETRSDCQVKAPFMMMDCLPGNVGMDLGMDVPERFKASFFKELSHIQVELSTIKLPKIGKIVSKNPDGTYEQGPIPGLGGPFNTATEYYQAWASKASFGSSPERLRLACGPYADEIIPSVASFPKSVRDLSQAISRRDSGPFPLFHGDFGHNNIVVDDEYRVLGVIDWEMAFAAPWEVFAAFPLTLSAVPPAMDAPSNYDEAGNPKDEGTRQKYADREHYIAAVREQEIQKGIDSSLSEALADAKREQLITAMRLYENGKAGLYSALLKKFCRLLSIISSG